MAHQTRYPRRATTAIHRRIDFGSFILAEPSKRQMRKWKNKFNEHFGYRPGDDVSLLVNRDNGSSSTTLKRDGEVIMQTLSVTVDGYVRLGAVD